MGERAAAVGMLRECAPKSGLNYISIIRYMTAVVGVVLLSLCAVSQQTPQQDRGSNSAMHSPEINTTLMETTFLITGPSARAGEEGKARSGTGFVMIRPISKDSDQGHYVLITAKHVFEDIKGDIATIVLRERNSAGDAEPFPASMKIRDGAKALYTAHPSKDIAAIDISLPPNSIAAQLGPNITNLNWLSSDEFLHDIEIHPGDELLCLGYPLGLAANDAGYPILRSGELASYPVIPLKKPSRILYDFRVHPGNSGGPVYFRFSNRVYKGGLAIGTYYQKIFGIVTEQYAPIQNTDPSIGVIIPSVYIKETIDLLAGFESKIKE